jgi:hypothetical protein
MGLAQLVMGWALPVMGLAQLVMGWALPVMGLAQLVMGWALPVMGLAQLVLGWALPVMGLAQLVLGWAHQVSVMGWAPLMVRAQEWVRLVEWGPAGCTAVAVHMTREHTVTLPAANWCTDTWCAGGTRRPHMPAQTGGARTLQSC